MILDDTNTVTRNSLLFKIATLSPKATQSLELESYRLSAQWDGADLQYALEDGFQHLIKDLEGIGVIIGFDYSDYLENTDRLAMFLDVCELLLPNTLYPMLATDSHLKRLITDIVQGSIGADQTILETYLSEIGGLEGLIPYRPELTDYLDGLVPQLNQTGLFSDYFKNLLELHHEEKLVVDLGSKRHQEYRVLTRELIGRLTDAVNILADPVSLSTIVNVISRDFLDNDNLVDYAYLFLEDHSTLPADLHDRYERKLYQYTVSHPWCYPYYELRKKEVSPQWQNVVVAAAYMLADNLEAYDQALKVFRGVYGTIDADTRVRALYKE